MLLPEGYEDMPECGIRVGPPDIDLPNLPLEYKVKLNNQLYDRKLFTLADVRRRPDEIRASLQSIFRIDVQAIMNIYKEETK